MHTKSGPFTTPPNSLFKPRNTFLWNTPPQIFGRRDLGFIHLRGLLEIGSIKTHEMKSRNQIFSNHWSLALGHFTFFYSSLQYPWSTVLVLVSQGADIARWPRILWHVRVGLLQFKTFVFNVLSKTVYSLGVDTIKYNFLPHNSHRMGTPGGWDLDPSLHTYLRQSLLFQNLSQ